MSYRNYTINSVKTDLSRFNLAQITLNRRIFPSKRDTESALRLMCENFPNTKIVVHTDFIYGPITRFGILSDFVRKSVVSEIASIRRLSVKYPQIVGIITHMDAPIRKEVYTAPLSLISEKVNEAYSSAIFSKDRVWDILNSVELDLTFKDIFTQFYKAVKSESIEGCKVFIENTTKLYQGIGTVDSIARVLGKEMTDVLGICVDTEHYFAVEGKYPDLKAMVNNFKADGISVMVHLNTVPSSVKPGSCKDEHSFTQIDECSVNSKEFYVSTADFLNENNVNWVREVKEDIAYVEIPKWIKNE